MESHSISDSTGAKMSLRVNLHLRIGLRHQHRRLRVRVELSAHITLPARSASATIRAVASRLSAHRASPEGTFAQLSFQQRPQRRHRRARSKQPARRHAHRPAIQPQPKRHRLCHRVADRPKASPIPHPRRKAPPRRASHVSAKVANTCFPLSDEPVNTTLPGRSAKAHLPPLPPTLPLRFSKALRQVPLRPQRLPPPTRRQPLPPTPGFHVTALPAASACNTCTPGKNSGKFAGPITSTCPIGSR